jgi:hypothetical protein
MVWLKTVKFQADAKYLACAKDLTILSMAGAIPHLETTCTRFNINKEENMLISGTR